MWNEEITWIAFPDRWYHVCAYTYIYIFKQYVIIIMPYIYIIKWIIYACYSVISCVYMYMYIYTIHTCCMCVCVTWCCLSWWIAWEVSFQYVYVQIYYTTEIRRFPVRNINFGARGPIPPYGPRLYQLTDQTVSWSFLDHINPCNFGWQWSDIPPSLVFFPIICQANVDRWCPPPN